MSLMLVPRLRERLRHLVEEAGGGAVRTDCALPAEVLAACPTAAAWRGQPGPVGDLRRGGERRHVGGGRRRAGVAVHRQGVLGPHFGVLDLGGRDGRGVLPERVGRHQQRQLAAVGRDLRRRHVRGERRLIGGGRRGGLGCGFGGLGGGGLHPAQVGRDRGRHRQRRRTHPVPGGQGGDHRGIGRQRGLQFGGQPVPGRGGGPHRPRSGPGIHPARVELRRKRCVEHVYTPCLVGERLGGLS